MRLFIVDDDAAVLRALDLQLRPLGLVQHGFSEPEPALVAARTQAPELAVVDFNLPRMNGLELVRRLKEANPRLRAMLITAQVGHDDVAKAQADGLIDIVLAKPWRMFEMIEKVRELAALPR